jgi:hypothetical protein
VDINKQCDSRPSMSDIEKVTQQLFEKESRLKEIAFQLK